MIKQRQLGDQIQDHNRGADRDHPEASRGERSIRSVIVGHLVRKMRGARAMGFPDFLVPFASGFSVQSKFEIRLQVNVAVAAEAKWGRVGEGFQVGVCTGVVEQAF